MHALDYVYIGTIIWQILGFFGLKTPKDIILYVLSFFYVEVSRNISVGYTFGEKFKKNIVFSGGPAPIFVTEDHEHHAGTSFAPIPYPRGKLFVLRIENHFAVVILPPHPLNKDATSYRKIDIWASPEQINTFWNLVFPKKPKTTEVKVRSLTATKGELSFRNISKTNVLTPGLGCDAIAWGVLLAIMDGLQANVDRNLLAGRPAGGCVLFVGPPGTGKTTLALHAASYLGLSMVQSLRIQAQVTAISLIGSLNEILFSTPIKTKMQQVFLLDDFDRTFEDNMSFGEFFTLLDTLITGANLVILTANSIEGMDPALLSRMHVHYLDLPTKDTLGSQLEAVIGCEPEEVQEILDGLGDGPIDLRQLRRVTSIQRHNESFLEARARMLKAESMSLFKADEDGDKWIKKKGS